MEFSQPEDQSGQPFSSPGDLPNPGIKPRSPALQADSLPAEPSGKPQEPHVASNQKTAQRHSEQTPGDGEGQGSLVCYSPWGHKELDTTKPLNKNPSLN